MGGAFGWTSSATPAGGGPAPSSGDGGGQPDYIHGVSLDFSADNTNADGQLIAPGGSWLSDGAGDHLLLLGYQGNAGEILVSLEATVPTESGNTDINKLVFVRQGGGANANMDIIAVPAGWTVHIGISGDAIVTVAEMIPAHGGPAPV